MNYLERKQVNARLENILDEKLHVDMRGRSEEDFNIPMLGFEWGLKPRQMVYFMLEIEKQFGILIPQEHIVSGRFSTFNSISDIICEQLYKQALGI